MSASQATSPRHPWKLLLEQLTGRMLISHGWGTEDDAKGEPFGRITWIPGVPAFEAPTFSIPDAEVTDIQTVTHSVIIYGASPTECLGRAKELAGWLDVLAGPRQGDPGDPDASPPVPPRPGYDVRSTGSAPKGGGTGAGTWRLDVPVTLKDFVVRRFMPPTPIVSATVQIDAADAHGSEQATPNLDG